MPRYYTRVCNFYYGTNSKKLVKEKKSLPLNGIKEISFDKIQLISRNSHKEISKTFADNFLNTFFKICKTHPGGYLRVILLFSLRYSYRSIQVAAPVDDVC